MSQITTLAINYSYKRSIRKLIQSLLDDASAESEEAWIKVKEVSPGIFEIVDNSLTSGDSRISDPCELGLMGWDDEVQDLDAGQSDESQCFKMSVHLRWKDVDITPDELRASSVERLKEALSHVAFGAWCPGDL